MSKVLETENGQFYDIAIIRFKFNEIEALIYKFMSNHRDYNCVEVEKYLQILQQAARKFHAMISLSESTGRGDPQNPIKSSTPVSLVAPLKSSTPRNHTELSPGGNKYYTAQVQQSNQLDLSCEIDFQ